MSVCSSSHNLPNLLSNLLPLPLSQVPAPTWGPLIHSQDVGPVAVNVVPRAGHSAPEMAIPEGTSPPLAATPCLYRQYFSTPLLLFSAVFCCHATLRLSTLLSKTLKLFFTGEAFQAPSYFLTRLFSLRSINLYFPKLRFPSFIVVFVLFLQQFPMYCKFKI